MIAAALLLWLQATLTPAPVPPPAPMPPADWSALTPPYWRRTPVPDGALSRFARDEVAAGRCLPRAEAVQARLDLAVLVTPTGAVRRIVPRAIDCPTVEQFASGLVSHMLRGNVVGDPAGERWHRVSLDLIWSG